MMAKSTKRVQVKKVEIQDACDEVLASVEDCRTNGGTHVDVHSKTLTLLELVLDDID